MNTILICDDDKAFLTTLYEEVKSITKSMQRTAKIYTCSCPEEISDAVLSDCDIVFLDIDFEDRPYTGIDIARRLRRQASHIVIIFVTHYPAYAFDGYEVQAFRYLLKEQIPLKLRTYLEDALAQSSRMKKGFEFSAKGESVTLALDDVIYIESKLHSAAVYMQKPGSSGLTEYNYWISLSQLEQALEPYGFLRIQKSYLVNMRHLQGFRFRKAVLTGGIELTVSRSTYNEQKAKYLKWKSDLSNMSPL